MAHLFSSWNYTYFSSLCTLLDLILDSFYRRSLEGETKIWSYMGRNQSNPNSSRYVHTGTSMKSLAHCNILSDSSNDILSFHSSQVDDTIGSGTPNEEISPDKGWSENQFTLSAPLFFNLSQQTMPLWSPSLMAVSVIFSAGVCPDCSYLTEHPIFSCMVTWVSFTLFTHWRTHNPFLFQRPLLLSVHSFSSFLFLFFFLYLPSVLRIQQVLDSISQRVSVATSIYQDFV